VSADRYQKVVHHLRVGTYTVLNKPLFGTRVSNRWSKFVTCMNYMITPRILISRKSCDGIQG